MSILDKFFSTVMKYIKITFIYFTIWSLVFAQITSPIMARNIAMIEKSNKGNVINSANNIPIINIGTPNDSGLSHNEFEELDVGKEGVIFNNAHDVVETDLAGWIFGNDNIKKDKEASIILAEVRSKKSELLGYMEVAGKSSDLIIANTNGLTCDGCGFINVNRGILTTGSPIFNSNSLDAFKVSSGEILIGRNGFNGVKANRIDLIAQSLRLDGEVRGNNVNVNLGRQTYNYSTGNSKFLNDGQKKDYVISSSAFGGIYGNAIRLVSKEQGVGVGVDFNMATSGSKLEIDVDGNLKIHNKISSGEKLDIKAKNIEISNSGDIYSSDTFTLKGNDILLLGKVYSEKDSNIISNNINILGSLYSKNNLYLTALNGEIDITSNSNVGSGNYLDLTSKNLNLSGNLFSEGDLFIKSQNVEILGNLSSLGNLNVNSNSFNLIGLLTANKDVNLDLLENLEIKGKLGVGNNLNILGKDINLYAGSEILAEGSLKIKGNNLNIGIGNSHTSNDNIYTLLGAKKDLSLDILDLIDIKTKGNLTSYGDLNLSTNILVNRGFIAGDSISLNLWELHNLGKDRIGNSFNSYNNAGSIWASNNINILGKDGGKANHIINVSSSIEAFNGDINIKTKNFENKIAWWDFVEHQSNWFFSYEEELGDIFNQGHTDKHHLYIYWHLNKYYDKKYTYDIYSANSAKVNAGGNINIDADTILNQSSIISSGGNIYTNSAVFKNETVGKMNYTQTKLIRESYKDTIYDKGCGGLGNNWGCEWDYDSRSTEKLGETFVGYTYRDNYFASKEGAFISAKGNISIKATQKFGNGVQQEHINYNQGNGNNLNLGEIENIEESLGNIINNIADGNKFYPADETSPYAYESNPYYRDLGKFKGSEYFLDKLGLTLNGDPKILGDGYVDLEVIKDQILKEKGQELLEDYDNQVEQMEDLMQQGLDVKDELGLILGNPLTTNQLKDLKNPIIWWVYQEVNGQKVLVPQVFFPSDYKNNYDKNKHGSGSNIIGNNVDIEINGEADNNGNIIADENINISGNGDFNNNGNLITTDNSEEHLQNIKDMEEDLQNKIDKVEDLNKNYDSSLKDFEDKKSIFENKLNNYNQVSDRYALMMAEYNAILAKLNSPNKYSGKIWYLEQQSMNSNALLQEELNKYLPNINNLQNELKNLGADLQLSNDVLQQSSNKLRESGINLNNQIDSINKLQEDIKTYTSNINGINIDMIGNVNNKGNIAGDKVNIIGVDLVNMGDINGRVITDISMSNDIYNVNGNIYAGHELNFNGKNLYNITTENKEGWRNKNLNQEKNNIKTEMKEKEFLLVSNKKKQDKEVEDISTNKTDKEKDDKENLKEDPKEETANKQDSKPQTKDTKGITLKHRSSISSGGTININLDGTLLNRAGEIYSSGDMNIDVGSILMDTTAIEKSSYTKGLNYGTKKEEKGLINNNFITNSTKETYSLRNEVSTLGSGGNLSLKTKNNFVSLGGKIDIVGSASFDIGDAFIMQGVYDYDYEKETTITTENKKALGLVKLNSKETTEVKEQEQYTANKGSLNIGGNLNIVSKGNIELTGVNLNTGGDASLYAGYELDDSGNLISSGYVGDINIFHMENVYNSFYTKDVEQRGLTKDTIKDGLKSVEKAGKSLAKLCTMCEVIKGEDFGKAVMGSFSAFDDTNLEVSIGYDKSTTINEKITNIVKGEINVGGDLTMNATGNMIQLADVNVGGDYTRKAIGNIIDYEAYDTYIKDEKVEIKEIKFTAGIGNSYNDALDSMVGVRKAVTNLKDASLNLIEVQKDYQDGKTSSMALAEALETYAFASLNIASAALSGAGAYVGASTACATSLCTGLYFSEGIKYEQSSLFTNDWGKLSVGSNIQAGGNININADNYSKTGGSIFAEDDINFNVKKDLNLKAGTNSYGGLSLSKDWSVEATINSSSGVGLNAGYNQSKDKYNGTSYNNLQIISGGNISQNVGGNYIAQGLNLYANDTISQNIKGNKILQSMQNEYESTGNSFGVRGGISSNISQGISDANINGGSLGFNIESHKNYSLQTNQASTETAGKKVDITVGGKFTNIGAVVANIDDNGNDLGNLSIKAKEYEYINIKNIEYSKSKNISLDLSIGKSGDIKKNTQFPTGSFTLAHKNIEFETTSSNLATIGSGSIQLEQKDSSYKETSLNNQPNRDINNIETEKQTYFKHNVDGTVTIDLRWFSKNGRDSIESDLKSYPLTPMWSYYIMEDKFGYYPDLKSNQKCTEGQEGCINGYTQGTPVTGLDSSDPKKDKPLIFYDDSSFMRVMNKVWGVQTWSQAHDVHINNYTNNDGLKIPVYSEVLKILGEKEGVQIPLYTQISIVPFFVMGTYGGIYGTILNKRGEYK